MSSVLDLIPPLPPARRVGSLTRAEEAFAAYHRANPAVYAELCKLARDLRAVGHESYGIGSLFEVIRWHRALAINNTQDYELNNNYRAYYARLIMHREPELAGFFRLRTQKSGSFGAVLRELSQDR